ncbi:MAG: phosphotransferase [Anaerolineales bacterium]|nr:phosphotransferase [Anaerolineales bacterium]
MKAFSSLTRPSAQTRDSFTPHAWQVCEQVRVGDAYTHTCAEPAGLRVIHHDLWHGNLTVHHSRLHARDFEDTVWGNPAQDTAMSLQDPRQDVAAQAFEPLRTAARLGYESRIPWPEVYRRQIDTLQAGRMLWAVNSVARFESRHLAEHIAVITPLCTGFLETGPFRKVPS